MYQLLGLSIYVHTLPKLKLCRRMGGDVWRAQTLMLHVTFLQTSVVKSVKEIAAAVCLVCSVWVVVVVCAVMGGLIPPVCNTKHL